MDQQVKFSEDIKVYLNEQIRANIVWELLVYAHMIYNKVFVFKNFDAFAKSFQGSGNRSEVYWEGIHYEKLIDDFKICTAFENYNKAILLSKGYMVHMLDTSGNNRQIVKDQKNQPVQISEYLKGNVFSQSDRFSSWTLEGVKNSTIPLSWTLNAQYQSIIELDVSFLTFLTKKMEKRNRLHYYKNYSGAFKVETYLSNIEFAKNYGIALIDQQIKIAVEKLKQFD